MFGLGAQGHADKVRRVPIFAPLTDKELTLVGRLADEVSYHAGEQIVREGVPEYEFYIIVSGTADVSRDGNVIATLGPSDYFGELAILDHAPRNATVTATSQVKALVFPMREFGAAVDQIPALRNQILKGMARRIHAADGTPVK